MAVTNVYKDGICLTLGHNNSSCFKVNMWVLTLLSSLLLITGSRAQCSNVVISNQWQGNYQADFTDNAPVAVNGLSLEFTFHAAVDSVDFYQGTSTQIDDTTFLLEDTTTNVGAGEQISFQFQVHYSGLNTPLVVGEVMNGVSLCDAFFTTPAPLSNPCDETGMTPYDYSQVLCMSYVFFEAQRSGPLPMDQRVTWRGDSALDDGSDVGEDLTGGYYDAGDHVKFGFPMAFTATMLAWGLVDFAEGHETAGQTEYGQEALKWATDYFLKAYTNTNEFYGQGPLRLGLDRLTTRSGVDLRISMARPAYKIDEAHPGSDLAAETAAALAAASIAFATADPAYAASTLAVAKELYDFADNYRELYHVSIPDADGYYMLVLPTDGRGGVLDPPQCLPRLAEERSHLHSRGPRIPRRLGANRHAANVAFLSFWAAKQGIDPDTNRQWAQGQIGQLLGDNSRHMRSFVIGFGQNHLYAHTTGPGEWWGPQQPRPQPHTLYGALVGGPTQAGDYEDDRNNYINNEVACDYNAAFTGALAALVELN
ncbi:hypothetical protein Pcinc_023060 [Petrolisthes cinctipes]|uniref:Endoglucanase n=1 Tax=Petrolisthes cinctipes TaxID=88211 RepID=A0AAE1FDU9_PETCI|nr:hypothetical protein Pcinc_023060 [Petrolisthes cinctipes]